MSDPAGLIGTARRLAQATSNRPRQSDLKRAISTAYYALFHAVARSNADRLVGSGAHRSRAWTQVYRALDHGAAKTACQQLHSLGFSPDIVTVGQALVFLQEARHRADYDPHHRVSLQDALTGDQGGRGRD